MIRKIFVSLFILLAAAAALQAQETLKTLTLSSDFSAVAGTPRVVRNGFKHFWVSVWRQQGNPAKLVSRTIQSDGTMGAPKTLASGVTAFEGAFDIAYDPVNYTYLLAFETVKGLQVQFFNTSLAKVGQPSLIEGGLSNSTPRLSYDLAGKKFLLFYVSTQDGASRRVLKSRNLDPQGKPLADARTLATAAAGKQYGFMSASRNSKTGNVLVLVIHGTSGSAELLGYAVKPDGSLQKPAALKVQPATVGFNTMADASFADDGSGFVIWADRTAIKYRKINAAMAFSGAAKPIAGAADSNSAFASLILDSLNTQYLGVWTRANQVVSAALNTATGAVLKPPFGVADSTLTNSRNSATSYDPTQGNGLVVWEDSSAPAGAGSSPDTKFRIRAAIYFLAGSSATTRVSVGDNFYSPAQLTVRPGTTVQWTFEGRNPHTVSSSNSSLFDSGTMNQGATFQFRFTSPGTIQYFCRVHGQSMSGTITVTGNEEEPPDHY